MLRAILFDFNGTIVDDEPVHFELFQRVLAEEGVELTESDYYEEYLGFDDWHGFRHGLASQGRADEEGVNRLVERKARYYREHMAADGFPFFPGVLELIDACRSAGVRLGIVSGALRGEIEMALEQARLESAFATVVGAEDTSRSKPDPEGFVLGLERLNRAAPEPHPPLLARQTVAIEDTVEGLAAADAAGLATVAVAHTTGAAELHADLVVEAVAALDVERLARLVDEGPGADS